MNVVGQELEPPSEHIQRLDGVDCMKPYTFAMRTKTSNSVDDYIAGFPSDVQAILEKVRTTIKKAAPAAEETIKYQLPTFTLKGNLVHFGAFKEHVGFYPAPQGI